MRMFTETTRYAPNSPYSASKASSDHLVRAWHHTYGLPVVTTNCSNNYGPWQFPEKLIPLMILNGLDGKPLPVYGNGRNVRDWLYVEDHARALWLAVTHGTVGEVYNIGGQAQCANIDIVQDICDLLDELAPAERARRESDHLRHRPPRPRPPLCHGHQQDRARPGLAADARPSPPACARPCSGISTTVRGGPRSAKAVTPASVWASAEKKTG